MKFGKEKTILTGLLTRVQAIHDFSEANFDAINEFLKDYSSVMTKLYKGEPNIFANLYKHELVEIRHHRKLTKEMESPEIKQSNFSDFRNSMEHAIERTIDYINEYVQS